MPSSHAPVRLDRRSIIFSAMHRRQFRTGRGSAAALYQCGCLQSARASGSGTRPLKRIGLQLYSLRDDARRDLSRTIADIAAVGYNDVELLGSMNNFGMPPKELRRVLDRKSTRLNSSHQIISYAVFCLKKKKNNYNSYCQ